LLLGALAAGTAGQYWLSVAHEPIWSAAAWIAASVCVAWLFAASRDARILPPAGDAELPAAVERTLLVVVLCIGVFFVVFRLAEFPPGLNHDAAWEGMYAIRILNGEPYTPYVADTAGHETFTLYLKALSIRLLGATQLGVEGPSIVAGLLILPFFYWWSRSMFGARLALMATLLLGTSGWHLVFSRTGWRSDLQPLFTTITCGFFVRAMMTASRRDFTIAGLGLAATVNTYNGARAFPLLFPVWGTLVMLQSWHWRGFLRRYGAGLLAFSAAFVIATAPLAWVAVTRWDEFQKRALSLASAYSLAGNLQAAALLFNYRGNGNDFFLDTPGLEFLPAVFLVFGVAWALASWRDERAQFLLLGVVINLLPGLASSPNLNRTIGTMPFIYIIVALGVMCFARELARVVPRGGTVTATAFLVIVSGAAASATYSQYLGRHRRAVWGYYPETTVLGRYMHGLAPQYTIWVGGANFPAAALTFLTYQGSGNPEHRNYIWLDDVTAVLRDRPVGAAGKGLAFILASAGAGPAVVSELAQRYPRHQTVELRYPEHGGAVFATALLVPPDSQAAVTVPVQAAQPMESAYQQDPPGQLRGARAVAVTNEGNVVVCDVGNNRIQEFDGDWRFVRQWGHRGEGQAEFKDPCGIAVGPTGEIFVADTWNHRVQVFTPTASYVGAWQAGLFSPRGIAVDSRGSIFVSDSGHNRVVRLSASGQQELAWGSKGSGHGEFIEPIGITTDAAGHVYVCDNGNGRLQVFTRAGQFVSSFDVPGWERTGYSEPYVAVDGSGTVWVTVPTRKEVRAYDERGTLLRTITGTSLAGARFNTPMGIAFNPVTHEIDVSDLRGTIVHFPAAKK
jgi:sugar lactone lactonase YvrE